MKDEYTILMLSSLVNLIIGLTCGFIMGIVIVRPNLLINLILIIGSIIVFALGLIYIIIKQN